MGHGISIQTVMPTIPRRQPLMIIQDGISFYDASPVISIPLSRSRWASFRPLLISSVLFIVALLMPLGIAAIQPNVMDPFMGGVLAKIENAQPKVEQVRLKYDRVVSSWYDIRSSSTLTASGERFDEEAMTVASRSLRFGTMLLIRNPVNGNYTIARVTDRGPFVEGRDLDVSKGIARKLGIIDIGVAPLIIAKIGEGDIRPILNNLSPQTITKGLLHQTHSHVRHSSNLGHSLKHPTSHLTGHTSILRTYTLYQPHHPMN